MTINNFKLFDFTGIKLIRIISKNSSTSQTLTLKTQIIIHMGSIIAY